MKHNVNPFLTIKCNFNTEIRKIIYNVKMLLNTKLNVYNKDNTNNGNNLNNVISQFNYFDIVHDKTLCFELITKRNKNNQITLNENNYNFPNGSGPLYYDVDDIFKNINENNGGDINKLRNLHTVHDCFLLLEKDLVSNFFDNNYMTTLKEDISIEFYYQIAPINYVLSIGNKFNINENNKFDNENAFLSYISDNKLKSSLENNGVMKSSDDNNMSKKEKDFMYSCLKKLNEKLNDIYK